MQLSDLDAWDDAERRRQELRSSQKSNRNMLHAEAKEISEQYSEENKKLVLKMNLEKVSIIWTYLYMCLHVAGLLCVVYDVHALLLRLLLLYVLCTMVWCEY